MQPRNIWPAWRKPFVLALVGMFVAGFLSLGTGTLLSSASAAGTCSGGEATSRFAGATKDTYDTTLFGVRANIEYQSPALCNSGDSPSWSEPPR